MRSGYWYLIGLAIWFAILPISVMAQDVEPEGFLGYKWETPKESIEELQNCSGRALTDISRCSLHDKMIVTVGKASIYRPSLSFWEGKLCGGFGGLHLESDFSFLLETIKSKYGKPTETEDMKNVYDKIIGVKINWTLKQSRIMMEFNYAKKEGFISYFYAPIMEKYMREKTKSDKEEMQKAKDSL